MGLRRNAKQAAYSKGVRNKVQYSAKSLDISSGSTGSIVNDKPIDGVAWHIS